jgi:hypothetical protein
METKSLVKVEEKVLYRYTDNYQYSDMSFREPRLSTFKILRETEKSYFIHVFLDGTRRVPKEGKNIFAWDTEEKAIYNYFKRKQVHVSIIKNKLDIAQRNLQFAEKRLLALEEEMKNNPTTKILHIMDRLKLIYEVKKDENN